MSAEKNVKGLPTEPTDASIAKTELAAAVEDAKPVTSPEDEKRVADFLNRFATNESQAKAMRQMIEEKAEPEAFVKKFGGKCGPDSHYLRHLAESYKQVIA